MTCFSCSNCLSSSTRTGFSKKPASCESLKIALINMSLRSKQRTRFCCRKVLGFVSRLQLTWSAGGTSAKKVSRTSWMLCRSICSDTKRRSAATRIPSSEIVLFKNFTAESTCLKILTTPPYPACLKSSAQASDFSSFGSMRTISLPC